MFYEASVKGGIRALLILLEQTTMFNNTFISTQMCGKDLKGYLDGKASHHISRNALPT